MFIYFLLFISKKGNMFMQLKSVPVKNIDWFTFVYGFVKLTDIKSGSSKEIIFPVQGLIYIFNFVRQLIK
jgi:hypothetical protein